MSMSDHGLVALRSDTPKPSELTVFLSLAHLLGHTAEGVSAVRWRREIEAASLPPAHGALAAGGTVDIARHDVFALGAGPITEENVLQLWYLSTAWGLGRKGFRMRQKLSGLASTGQDGARLLAEAWTVTRAGGGPAECYDVLLDRRGTARIPFFGAAFATKFLYFCHGQSTPRNLILDSAVAGNLRRMDVWPAAPTNAWWSPTYATYCDLLLRWAQQASPTNGQAVRADQVEMALFTYKG